MGLHQKITDRTTSEPCDCGEDDDHGPLMDDPQAIQEMVDEAVPYDYNEAAPEPEDVWTDGSE